MNKELEESIERIKYLLTDGCDCESCKKDKRAYRIVLKELERLQEENSKIQTEIANHVYWESTPVDEIKKMYIPKDKIRNKLEQDKENYIDAIHADNKVEAVHKYIDYLDKELLKGKQYNR